MGGIIGGDGKKGDNVPVPDMNMLLDLQRKSRVNQVTPLGQTQYGSYDESGNFVPSADLDVQKTTLNPEQQKLFEGGTGIASSILGTLDGANIAGGPKVVSDTITQSVQPFDIRSANAVESAIPMGGNLNDVGTGIERFRTANQIEGRLPGLDTNFGAQAERAGNAVFDSGMMRLRPQFEQQKQRLESDLFARGIPMSSDAAANEAGTGALDDMRRSQGDTQQQLALASVLAGNDEAARLFGQDLSVRQNAYGEQMGLAGLQSGQRGQQFGEQVTQFGLGEGQRTSRFGEQLSLAEMEQQRRKTSLAESLAAYGVNAQQQGINQAATQIGLTAAMPNQGFTGAPPAQGIDAMAAFNAMQGAQTANAQARNSTKGSLLGAAGTIGAAKIAGPAAIAASDIRLKENIVPVGIENGHKVYEFSYKGRPERYRGVMAQEVPEAAIVMPNGYLAVDYSKIGVEFRRAA